MGEKLGGEKNWGNFFFKTKNALKNFAAIFEVREAAAGGISPTKFTEKNLRGGEKKIWSETRGPEKMANALHQKAKIDFVRRIEQKIKDGEKIIITDFGVGIDFDKSGNLILFYRINFRPAKNGEIPHRALEIFGNLHKNKKFIAQNFQKNWPLFLKNFSKNFPGTEIFSAEINFKNWILREKLAVSKNNLF